MRVRRGSADAPTPGVIAFFVLVILFFVLVGPRGCTDEPTARRLLEQQGYTNVEITGYRPWMKSDSDSLSTGFRATAPNGRTVTGAVTGGWMKGSTIRFD